jgi:Fe2+ or Zn2+ uptake regulation protein
LTNATELLYIENMIKTHAEKICEERGLRKTKTRLLLFEVLGESRRPLAIPDILETFRKKGYEINKTTLYREVELLVSEEVLRSVQIATRKISYELASHGHHHHFVCTGCNYVMDVVFPEAVIEKTEQALAREGVIVEKHSIEFFGLCKMCN